jgi:hypothetical protein
MQLSSDRPCVARCACAVVRTDGYGGRTGTQAGGNQARRPPGLQGALMSPIASAAFAAVTSGCRRRQKVPDLLSYRRVPRRLHVDGVFVVRQAGTTRSATTAALGMGPQARRERLVQVAPTPGVPFDSGRFEIIVGDLT